jgi:hypothetical protein
MWNIGEIEPVLNGWIVHVGCKRVVFTNKKEMLKEIGRYLDNPQKVDKEYQEKSVNAHLPLRSAAMEVPLRSATMESGVAACDTPEPERAERPVRTLEESNDLFTT